MCSGGVPFHGLSTAKRSSLPDRVVLLTAFAWLSPRTGVLEGCTVCTIQCKISMRKIVFFADESANLNSVLHLCKLCTYVRKGRNEGWLSAGVVAQWQSGGTHTHTRIQNTHNTHIQHTHTTHTRTRTHTQHTHRHTTHTHTHTHSRAHTHTHTHTHSTHTHTHTHTHLSYPLIACPSPQNVKQVGHFIIPMGVLQLFHSFLSKRAFGS